MTSPFQHVYMAAMVLNNMGISLLERQAKEKAMEVLSAAVVLMRAISKGNSLTDPQLLHTVQIKLTEANQQLAASPVSSHSSDIHVITHQDIFDVVRNSCQGILISNKPSPPVLIRIERIASILDDENNYFPGFEASIILYNLGTTYLQMATGAIDVHVSNVLEKRRCACGLFELSYSILQNLVLEPTAQDHADFKHQYLPFMIRVVQSLIYTTSSLGLTSESAFYSSTISILYGALQPEHDTSKLFILHTARAA